VRETQVDFATERRTGDFPVPDELRESCRGRVPVLTGLPVAEPGMVVDGSLVGVRRPEARPVRSGR